VERGGPDRAIVFLVLGLVVFGILMVYNASILEAYQQGYEDKYYFLKFQSLWALVGLGFAAAAMIVDLERVKKAAPLLFLGTFLLQALTLAPGLGVKAYGAQRWLRFGSFQVQPSELAKLVFVVYLAAWLSSKPSFSRFLFLSGALSGLVLLGRDLGTAVIIFLTGLAVYFVSGAPIMHLILIIPPAIAALVLAIVVAPYRMNRILALRNPLRDPMGSSYHIVQILLALGSGGLFGLGIGQSRQKYQFIPAVSTDSIFAVIGEELGFVGGAALIAAYLILAWRGFRIAQEQTQRFKRLLAFGITAWLSIQAFVNLGAMVALFPLTGVPLPFVSRGGSNLVVSLIGVGLLLNISWNRK
jgi:cell division protein FtsW